MLKPINQKDLLLTNENEDDRTNTFLQLDDYDWMSYILNTRFRTEEQGILEVKFDYFGMTTSRMEVIQKNDGKEEIFTFEYDTDIFEKYITEFLTKHIAAWKSQYAFNGEDIVIAFYNEVLEKGKLI